MTHIPNLPLKKILATAAVLCMVSGALPIAVSSFQHADIPDAVLEPKTIDRGEDPVIVTGSQISGYTGYANANIFVWAFRGGSWQQVVFQIDEANGYWPYGGTVHKRYLADGGLMDSDDEICFMTSETGDRVDPGTWAPGADTDKPRIEITAYDPNTGNRGWAYLFHHTSPPTWTSASYVSWNEATNSLTATNYTMDYPDDDAHNTYFSDLRVTVAGGGTAGQFIDREKFYDQWLYLFITNRICEQTWTSQWSGNDDDGYTSENGVATGPVRTIRHWRICYSPGGTFEWGEKISFQVYYYRSMVHRLEHGRFWGSTTHQDDRYSIDHVLTSPAAQYWDGNGNTATVDGSATGDSFTNTSPLAWYQVSGPRGSYVMTSDTVFSPSTTLVSHFIDSSGTADTDGGRTGASAGKFGDIAMHRFDLPSGTTVWDSDYHIFLLPANAPDQGAAWHAGADNPVSTSQFPPASQSYAPSDADPPATATGTVLVNGLASYQATLGTAGSATLTATLDDAGTGGSAISGAVWTSGFAGFPGTPMAATDGTFDGVQEAVQATIDISSWAVGTYEIYVYGTDSSSNQNTTSAEHATITITDDLPPQTMSVMANGVPEYIVPLSEAFAATVTAVISDAGTGGSLIDGANLTLGSANWPGTEMSPDGPLDSDTESFSMELDISGWIPGTYLVHVYGRDLIPNHNTTSSAYAAIIITDDAVPEIRDVLVDGLPSLTVALSSLGPVTLTATVDDSGHGDNVIAGANYTLGVAAWPGTGMAPTDGLDSPTEGFSAVIDISGWAPGSYSFYVYGWDEMNDRNVSSNAHATVTILDDLAPRMLNGTAGGGDAYEVMLSAASSVMLTCTVDDSLTGGSVAAGANFTLGMESWPGTAMTPDGALDSPAEGFHLSLDISGWPAGTHVLYFYGWDAAPAFNATSLETVLIVIHDDFAPTIADVRINGTADFSVSFVNATSVELTALVDDMEHGATVIGGANWTAGIAGWPGASLSAADGAFDGVAEAVSGTVDISSWMPGTYLLYVYAWDISPNYNASSMAFAKLTIVDDAPPDIEQFLANGAKQVSTLLTDAPVTLSGWVNDTLRGGSLASVGMYSDGKDNSTLNLMEPAGTVNEPAERFTSSILHIDYRAGPHSFYMFGADSMNNFNETSGEHVNVTIIDNLAPSTGWTVKVNGAYSLTVGESGKSAVWVNATVSDERRGFLNITGANCTVGFGMWPGQAMEPVSGAFDNCSEQVSLQYNISAWPVGQYKFHVYGTDEAGNGNATAAEYATLNVEGSGPEINGVTADSFNPYLFASDAEFILVAYGDDRQRGNSIVAGAEYFIDTMGPDGTGIQMSPTGYKFDSPYEGAKALVQCSGWSVGEYHTFRIHFRDAFGYWGDWGTVFVCRQAQSLLPVQAGWNLISLPLVTPSSDLATILSGISWDRAFIYDPLDPNPWLSNRNGGPAEFNDFTAVDRTMGIWVHATAAGTLTISGGVSSSTAMTLHAGWNLVGYPTLTEGLNALDAFAGTGADMMAVFNPVSPFIMDITDLATVTMTPGCGYWVHVPADAVWTVNW